MRRAACALALGLLALSAGARAQEKSPEKAKEDIQPYIEELKALS